MSHIYMKFDFGTDEEKSQVARHKLDVWRQSFRLDKKLQYKLDRVESGSPESAEKAAEAEEPATAEKPKAKGKGKVAETATEKTAPAANGRVRLLVRLYFSSHEKLSEQGWLDRIPSEEPFKSATPKIVRKGQAGFEEVDQEFESREKAENRNAVART